MPGRSTPRSSRSPADPAGDAAALDRLARWAMRWSPLVEVDGDGRPAARRQRGRASVRRRARAAGRRRATASPRLGLDRPQRDRPDPRRGLGAGAVRHGPARSAGTTLAPALAPLAGRRAAPVAAGHADARAARAQDDRGAGRDRAAQPCAPLPRGRQSAGRARPRAWAQARAADRGPPSIRRRAPACAWTSRSPSRGRAPRRSTSSSRAWSPSWKRASSARGSCRWPGFGSTAASPAAAVATAIPSREPGHLRRLLADKAAALDPGFGFDAFALTADWAEPLGAAQDSLVEEPSGERDVARLVDRLSVKLGPRGCAGRARSESHLPERASGWATATRPSRQPHAARHRGRMATRPQRLLDRPEAIAVIYATPEGLPRRFVWRRAVHDIARVEGPERIAPEWWRQPSTRAAARLLPGRGRCRPPLLDLPRRRDRRRPRRRARLVHPRAVRVS